MSIALLSPRTAFRSHLLTPADAANEGMYAICMYDDVKKECYEGPKAFWTFEPA